ncbi:MAG: DUF1592 domain-containing protein [Myxococcales bacterium]|nr:DUF1592 domain-containing protein [Myxococcales bacterium]
MTSKLPVARPRRVPLRAWGAVALLGVITAFVGPRTSDAAEAAPEAKAPHALLATYCAPCHGEQRQRGGFDLDALIGPFAPEGAARAWQRVRAALTTGDMPPDEELRQPTPGERDQLVAFASHQLALHARPTPGRAVARRLTRIEFNNALKDLIGHLGDVVSVNHPFPPPDAYFQPDSGRLPTLFALTGVAKAHEPLLRVAGLPVDRRAEHGFSNQADALGVSPLMLERTFELMQALVDTLLRHPLGQGPLCAALAPVAPASASVATAQERLEVLASQAFRRPPGETPLAPYLRVFARARQRGASFEAAMGQAAVAVLASPRFLYRTEPVVTPGQPRALDGWEVASRLSFFLWSTLPDARLREAALEDRLGSAEGLSAAVDRMLADPKVAALAEVFAFEWLGLDKLAGARPDESAFPGYYWGPLNKHALAGPMAFEALLLFETVLVENRSVLELLDAPYTYVNARLARHYGLAEAASPTLETERRRVEAALQEEATRKAPPDKPPTKLPKVWNDAVWMRLTLPSRERGGVMTTGATLTLTSGPRRTSPVKRGVWLLETIFNRPPPPPPFAVPPLVEAPPSVHERLPLRGRLEQHRRDPACAGCHARIDPLGFALARFDGVGGLVVSEAGQPIDATFTLPDGRQGEGPVGLKDQLLLRPRDFVRGFVEHLLSYALGRPVSPSDDSAIEAIVAATEPGGYRLKDIIHALVESQPFRLVEDPIGPGHVLTETSP